MPVPAMTVRRNPREENVLAHLKLEGLPGLLIVCVNFFLDGLSLV